MRTDGDDRGRPAGERIPSMSWMPEVSPPDVATRGGRAQDVEISRDHRSRINSANRSERWQRVAGGHSAPLAPCTGTLRPLGSLLWRWDEWGPRDAGRRSRLRGWLMRQCRERSHDGECFRRRSVTRRAPARDAAIGLLVRGGTNGRGVIAPRADRDDRDTGLGRAHHHAPARLRKQSRDERIERIAAEAPHRSECGEAAKSACEGRGPSHA